MSKKNIIKLFIAILILISINITSFAPISKDSTHNSQSSAETNISLFKKSNTNTIISSFFAIKKAHAAPEDRGGNMIIIGLEEGGSGGSGWVHDIWNFALSLVNIILIGILIFLGVVNILHLNYDTYQLKKFLVPLIVAVILANFSLFICRAVVDLSSALTNTFFTSQTEVMNNIAQGLGFVNKGTLFEMIHQIGGSNSTLSTTISVGSLIAYTLAGILVGIVLILLFLAITVLLYVRVFVVLILAAISPLAYIAMVVPATEGYFRQWWGWFLRWVFMGPVIALILKVAAILGKSLTTGSTTDGGFGAIMTGFFIFIAVIGLLIVALLVPFILGSQTMQKLMDAGGKAAGFAGKYVPGIREATSFGKGVVSKYAQNFTDKDADIQALGRGFAEGGIAGAQAENKMQQGERASKEAQRLVQFGEPGQAVDAKTLAKKQSQNSQFMKQFMMAKARDKDLDSEQLKQINQLVVSGGIKFKDEKEANDFRNDVDNAIAQQRKQYIKDNQTPVDVDNPLHAYDFKNGKPQKPKDSSGKDVSEENTHLGNAVSNIDMYDDIRKSSNIRSSVKREQAEKAIKNLGNIFSNEAGIERKYGKEKKEAIMKSAGKAFNKIEQDVHHDPSLRGLANKANFQAISQTHGIHKHVESFINDKSLDQNLSRREKAHVREFIARPMQMEDINGNPQKEQIGKAIYAHKTIKKNMRAKGLNPTKSADIDKYFGSDPENSKLKENFLENKAVIDRHQDYAQDMIREMNAKQKPIPSTTNPNP